MAVGKLTLSLIVLVVYVAVLEVTVAKKLYLSAVKPCHQEDYDNGFHNMKLTDINTPGNDQYENQKLNGRLKVEANLDYITVFGYLYECQFDHDAGIERCYDANNENEIFGLKNLCEHLDDKKDFTYNITTNIKDFKCPVKRGVYSIVDAPVNLEVVAAANNLTDGKWMLEVEFGDTNTSSIACFEYHFEFF